MPIRFEPIEGDKYHYNLRLAIGGWELEKKVSLAQLGSLKKDIDCILGSKDICDRYNCTLNEAQKIYNHLYNNNKCKACQFKDLLCYECINICESPLEKEIFLTFHSHNIKPELQKRINRDGNSYSYKVPVDKEKILTIPDFYLETKKSKFCIYADGHTFHEKNEYQISRDRSIDRELQKLGYQVLRYPGVDIRNNINKVVEEIKERLQE